MKALLLVVALLACAVPVQAQSPSFPNVFASATTMQHGQPCTVCARGDLYLAGWAFTWWTGQQPQIMAVRAYTTDGIYLPLAIWDLHWRGYRPDVATHYNAISPAWSIQPHLGFALYLGEVPPLNTTHLTLTLWERGYPPTEVYLPVTITP